ncbi:hypothetical protein Trydic_g20344 [Trypoxylus dichotomus]
MASLIALYPTLGAQCDRRDERERIVRLRHVNRFILMRFHTVCAIRPPLSSFRTRSVVEDALKRAISGESVRESSVFSPPLVVILEKVSRYVP